MAQSASSKRFGDFEADLRSGELRKAGVKLKFGIPSVFVTSVNGLSRMCSFSAADNCLWNCCALNVIERKNRATTNRLIRYRFITY